MDILEIVKLVKHFTKCESFPKDKYMKRVFIKAMIKSLPQVTEGALIRCLTGLGLFGGQVSVKQFKNLDTKGNDVRRLMNQLEIIQKTTKQSKSITLSTIGQELFDVKDSVNVFADLLHNVLMSKIPQYRVLTDFLSENEESTFANKRGLFNALISKQSTSGWNLPEPSFHTLIVLASMSGLIKKEDGVFSYRFKANSTTYLSMFEYCINEISQKIRTILLSTYDIVSCFKENISQRKIEMTSEIGFELLKSFRNRLNFEFKPGIGKKCIPGMYAFIEIK